MWTARLVITFRHADTLTEHGIIKALKNKGLDTTSQVVSTITVDNEATKHEITTIIIIIIIIMKKEMSQCCGIKQYTQTEKLQQIGQI